MDKAPLQHAEKVSVAPYGKMPDGTLVSIYTLTNVQGMIMKVMSYGGIVLSLTTPDRHGKFEDIVLGYDALSGYLENNPYMGALIGRCGNRIADGKFALDGKEYFLARNNNGNHLHGGTKGFDKVVWNIEVHDSPEGSALKLRYLSKDMEEGYPGNLAVEVLYILTDKNEFKIIYKATTDKKTIVNLTHHSYFNLTGNTKADILQHELMLHADRFIPVNDTLIPIGELREVSGTPFDFKTPFVIGSRIGEDNRQLKLAGGYDHCWVLGKSSETLKPAAMLRDPVSGRVVKVFTTEPGIQFYSGNFLDGSVRGKFNVVYNKHYGLCLETEHFPDTPHQNNFPSIVLNPGEPYESETVYAFGIEG